MVLTSGSRLQKTKSLVTPSWLTSSVKAGYPLLCGDYVAVKILSDETVHNCPDSSNCKGCAECSNKSRSASMEPVFGLLSSPPLPTLSPATGVSLVSDSVPWDLEKAKEMFDYTRSESLLVCTTLSSGLP